VKRQIKVAHIVTSYQSVVTILDSKLRALDKFDDLEVSIISSPSETDNPRNPAVRHIPLEMARTIKPFADFKSTWRLYKVLKREKFDVVHSHTAKAGFIAALAARVAGVPLICHTYHGLPFFEGQNRVTYRIYNFLEKVACEFRDCMFTQNKRDLSECIRLTRDKSKVLFEGNGVDIEYVRRCAKNQLTQALRDYPSKGIKLVLLSRLEPVKRIDDFFKVIGKLRQDGLKVSCVVAGTGFLEKHLKNQLSKMALDGCINMVGFTDRPHGLIAASDIVVLCSEKEGIPRAIMEAMALEKPVVATDVLGTQELVVDDETGFLVPLGDYDSMAKRINMLAHNINLRTQMGLAGAIRVQEHFNDIKIAKFLHDFYRQFNTYGR